MNYQEMIRELEGYWADYGCVLMQPYHTELGRRHDESCDDAPALASARSRGTSRTSSRRSGPTDGRYGENPFRFQHYFQYQVILKPAPEDVLDLYFALAARRSGSTCARTTCGSSRTTGSSRRSVRGGSAGRSGSTASR